VNLPRTSRGRPQLSELLLHFQVELTSCLFANSEEAIKRNSIVYKTP